MTINLNATVTDVSGAQAVGGKGDQIVNGSSGTDANVTSGTGNDTIRTAGGTDGVWSGEGADRVNAVDGSTGDDVATIHAGDGNDFVFGGEGGDNIYGEGGDDTLVGGGGSDHIDGGSGDDRIDGGAGDDFLTGGTGKDLFQFKVSNAKQHIDFGATLGDDQVIDFTRGQDKLDFSSIFARMTDASVDQFLTDVAAVSHEKYVKGQTTVETDSDGQATILVRGAATGLHGGAIEYSVLSTVTKGGLHSYTIQFHTVGDPESAWSSVTIDNVSSLSAADFQRETVKIAHGTSGDDWMDFAASDTASQLGTKGVRVYGFEGNDAIVGTAQHDELMGGNGNDSLNGRDGVDYLVGGNGNDTLVGGASTDYLYGGTGINTLVGDSYDVQARKDIFVFGGTVDKAGQFHLDKGTTTVTDFAYGQDFIKFANMGDGYNGSIANARLEQHFDVGSHMNRVNNDLVIYGDDKNTQYVLKNLFDGTTHRDGHAIDLSYVQHHADDFVIWA